MKASDCKECNDLGKNLKPVIHQSKWSPLYKCKEPNDAAQTDFGGARELKKNL